MHNKGKLVINKEGQYDFISKNGIRYSLYEAMTINKEGKHDLRSDMLIIFCDNYEDVQPRFVDYIFGASFIATMEDAIDGYVDDFEKSNVDFIEEVKKAKEF